MPLVAGNTKPVVPRRLTVADLITHRCTRSNVQKDDEIVISTTPITGQPFRYRSMAFPRPPRLGVRRRQALEPEGVVRTFPMTDDVQ